MAEPDKATKEVIENDPAGKPIPQDKKAKKPANDKKPVRKGERLFDIVFTLLCILAAIIFALW
ncbi:hypothetical protein [Dongshaea marina]|uniref:hypothetical protein n=1 Tax=Dongshaea marina TaxID=2047966 RepID=UPI000D3E430C|nr:hypothetical protein [Dongshaea marina]